MGCCGNDINNKENFEENKSKKLEDNYIVYKAGVEQDMNSENKDLQIKDNKNNERMKMGNENSRKIETKDILKWEKEEQLNIEEKERLQREEEERIKREEERIKREEEMIKRNEEMIKREEERIRREEEMIKREEERIRREEERLKRGEEETIKIEEKETIKDKTIKREEIKRELSKTKNEEIKFKEEIERIKRETIEKTKKVDEIIEKYRLEEEKKMKSQEEEQSKKDENEGRWKKYEKVGGEYRTKKEIREYLLPLLKYKDELDKFTIQPNINPPYNSGKLSDETIDIGLKMLNAFRYIVGIPNDVKNDLSYEKLAQDASLLMRVNNKMAHTGHPKPKDMNDKLFNSGAKGCASCNLYTNPNNMYEAVNGWIKDYGNFTTVGHRRWIIHPPMEKTGFGKVGQYYAMYCFDKSFKKTDYKNIPWPCRNMPLELGNSTFWSLSTGKSLPKDIEVTLTNYKTGKVEIFSEKNTNSFQISNDNYGLKGCVIFKGPSVGKEQSYRVDVKGTDVAISYDINFFNVECHHEKELLESIEPSCIIKGKKFYYCKLCDCKNELEIPMIPHKEKLINKIKPTCTKEGIEFVECEFCFKIIEKPIDTIPHNYDCSLISKTTGETKGVCKDCGYEINFNAPTEYKVWWKKSDSKEDSFRSSCPNKMQINSTLHCQISEVNGDIGFKEMVFDCSNNNLVEIEDNYNYHEDTTDLKFIGLGTVTVTIYPKYNRQNKRSFTFSIIN